MQLTEQVRIKRNNSQFDKIDHLSFLSKNLYNAVLYNIRQNFFKTGKYKHHNQVINDFTKERNPDYIAMPRKISQQTARLVGQNFRSFFTLIKKEPGKHRISKYLKKDGRAVVIIPGQAISKRVKEIDSGIFELTIAPKELDIKIVSRVKKPDMIRIVPRLGEYVIEIIHSIEEPVLKPDNGRYASVDLGVNNIATIYFNFNNSPQIYSGKPLKSINQFYNKKKAELQSQLPKGVKTSRRIRVLTGKRNNKVDWEMHNISRAIVNQLVSNDITKFIIGKNKNWKQDTNIGKRNNQNFVSIPFNKLVKQLRYKCELAGITVVETEESYTSKTSFLDREPVEKHSKYAGKRVRRGLFRTSPGTFINADVNAAANIMRKVAPEETYFKGVEDVVVHPIRVKPNKRVLT